LLSSPLLVFACDGAPDRTFYDDTEGGGVPDAPISTDSPSDNAISQEGSQEGSSGDDATGDGAQEGSADAADALADSSDSSADVAGDDTADVAGDDAADTAQGVDAADAADSADAAAPVDAADAAEASCLISHSNGPVTINLGQTYEDCAPLGTQGVETSYSQTMAFEACDAYQTATGAPSCITLTPSTGACKNVSLVCSTANGCGSGTSVCWTYTGGGAGSVGTTGNGCVCFTAKGTYSWN
jgi:hypothetical protein